MAIFPHLVWKFGFLRAVWGFLSHSFVYVFTMRVVIYDILSMAIITTLSTSILFCYLYYIIL